MPVLQYDFLEFGLWVVLFCASAVMLGAAFIQLRSMATLARQRLAAIEASSDGIGIIDAEQRLAYMNPALMRLHKIRPDEADEYIGSHWSNLYTLKGKAEILNVVMPALRRTGSWFGESLIKTKDGEVITAEMSLSLMPDGGIIGTARDITMRKLIEKEKDVLRQKFAQIEKMQAVGQLTGGIAHDFNNLMTIIEANIDMIKDEVPFGMRDTYLQPALRASARATELTQRLLAFARRQILQSEIINPDDVIPDTVAMLQRSLGRQVEIITDLGNGPVIQIDPGQLENAIVNLCINARDAMPKGGQIFIRTETVSIDEETRKTYSFMVPGDYACISVSDTGHGIPPELIGKIFDPFFTTKEAGKGSGLGLSMIYGFAKQSGGYVVAANNKNGGATFKLYFPAYKEEKGEERPVQEIRPEGRTILLVEGDPLRLQGDTVLLKQKGYQVHAAGNGAAAILMLDGISELDVLIADVALSDNITGIEVAEEARALFQDVPIIFASGYWGDEIRSGISRIPGHDFLAKPYSSEHLLEKINEVLTKSRKENGSTIFKK